ncbi:undecaprenyl-diphosphate phosphatase [Aestuariimicrobium sp. p3-SID1156]|uniref:undecaprenyl-diphosphate phosphatase n=1 Tax=Aestuariimicrobium sp. p3-SID1156 TaxID=2916038 RepID=UPI00223BF94D|nr:undecaprenyl-diphosphate phosphatase [Aestuariimicrobium sp. p3-SID1156]MCT1459823.1 undecaprenyl-diphosphate phosphatase [Aestuariimicrobium sp. p3-SID1156]
MGWTEAIILGILQGLTEFLPISSSAHLLIAGQLFFDGDAGSAFTAVTQLGTETAVILYFAKDIGRILKHWWLSLFGKIDRSDPDARMGWLIILGSLPIGVLGVLFKDQIDHGLRNLWITVTMLAGVAIIIWLADRHAANRKNLDQLTVKDGLLYGLAQAAALIPGVSRSGGTIAAGLAMGYKREAAARYAFLLAIPAVFMSGLFKLKDVPGDPRLAWGPLIVATIIAFAIGLAVIHWLLKYISTHDFKPFVIYRLILAAVVALLLITGQLDAVQAVS